MNLVLGTDMYKQPGLRQAHVQCCTIEEKATAGLHR